MRKMTMPSEPADILDAAPALAGGVSGEPLAAGYDDGKIAGILDRLLPSALPKSDEKPCSVRSISLVSNGNLLTFPWVELAR